MAASTTSDSLLTLTARAVEEVRAMTQKPDNTGKSLRVYVEQGGCSGMQYSLIFDEPRDGDLTSETDGVGVLVDAFSAQYLRGSQVDFSDDLTSGGKEVGGKDAC